MNPDLDRLHPDPFEQLRRLFSDLSPPAGLPHINLSIGEPKHATPPFILEAYARGLSGVANYPLTAGQPALREAIAAWATRRYGLKRLDPATQVLPVAGSREALFSFAQAVIDRTRSARVISPNPFYQIYEGAALLAGAQPLYLPTTLANGFRMEFERLSPLDWANVQLVYVCTPGNPTGRVMTLEEWGRLFELADRHGFIIASDE
jgi:N-succinyldiaminopimelate aminotransferase